MNDSPVRPADDEYLTRDEVCERLKISKRTLWEWTRAGIAPPRIKVGGTLRFPKASLDNFLQAHVEAAVNPAA